MPEYLNDKEEIKEKNKALQGMDTGIKFILATFLSVTPFLCQGKLSFAVIGGYMLAITFFAGLDKKVLLKSVLAYIIVIVLPYAFGLSINLLIGYFSPQKVIALDGLNRMIFKIIQLFLVWYIGSLYFHTTEMKSFIGLFDKILFPLKLLRIPVSDYLKVVMCIVIELEGATHELKENFGQKMSSVVQKSRWIYKINIKEISNILVSLIVNSFNKLERIQEFVETTNSEELYCYKLKLSKNDFWAIGSIVLLTILLFFTEGA
ncbi:MAG: energy-coupling factor transporter transmembrane component T [Eubacteriales bacterium]